jgi:hypothetical protein
MVEGENQGESIHAGHHHIQSSPHTTTSQQCQCGTASVKSEAKMAMTGWVIERQRTGLISLHPPHHTLHIHNTHNKTPNPKH